MSRSSSHARAEPGEPGSWPQWLRPLPGPQSRETIREWDRRAIEELGIPGIVLMENAGASAARGISLLSRIDPRSYPAPHLILCGPGNNGGDGLVVARYLADWGFDVQLRIPPEVSYRAGSDARSCFEVVRKLGIPVLPIATGEILQAGTVVDALFGTGLSRPLERPWLDWVRAINASGRPVISLDIPSGLDADSGEVLGEAVRARHTITFAASKIGFALASGPEHCGQVHVVDIGIPNAAMRPDKISGPRESGDTLRASGEASDDGRSAESQTGT